MNTRLRVQVMKALPKTTIESQVTAAREVGLRVLSRADLIGLTDHQGRQILETLFLHLPLDRYEEISREVFGKTLGNFDEVQEEIHGTERH